MILGSMAPRRRWLLLGLAALAVVALIAAGAVVITRLTGDNKPGGAPVAGSPTPSPIRRRPRAPAARRRARTSPARSTCCWSVWTPGSACPGGSRTRTPCWCCTCRKGLDRAYLFSLPRDLLVDIPAFPKAGYKGGKTKLTHAMSFGSRVPGKPKQPSTAQGYELLRSTVSGYTGLRIDAGAVLTFNGFDRLVDALGGVDIYVDQRVESMHRRPDGKYRESAPGGYNGPQQVYEKGERHLNGWQALDYARQRYIAGGDYARQRHQQQLIRAMTRKILDEGLARQPERVDQVVAALGDTLVYVGGRRIVDIAYALGGLPENRFTLVGLPGSGVGKGSAYRGEQLTSRGPEVPHRTPRRPRRRLPGRPPHPGRQELTAAQSRLGRAGFLVP